VTITPGSPPEQRNCEAERCYIAARARKHAVTKKQTYYFYFLELGISESYIIRPIKSSAGI